MSKALESQTVSNSTHPQVTATAAVPNATPLPEDLQKIQQLLDAGRPGDALKLASGRGSGGPLHVNARAVCLMRLGRPSDAVQLLRPAVVQGGSVFLRSNVPLVCKINFAIALAMSGNAIGARSVLVEIHHEDDPRVQSLKAAILRWEKQLSFWNWLQWKLGVSIDQPVVMDEPVGTLI